MPRSTSLHAYMFRSTCFHAICHVFMLRSIFSLYFCLDLHAYMLDITFLAVPCFDLHVYTHVSMPKCLDLCFHMLVCLVFFSICSMLFPMLDQNACVLLARFM